MNHDAESSSAAGPRHVETSDTDPDHERRDEEAEARERKKTAKQRRLDAKKKRIAFLESLLRELDSLAFVELIALYYLEYVCTVWPQSLKRMRRYNGSCANVLIAAHSSGSSSGPSSMSPSSRHFRTCNLRANMTNTSRCYP